MNGQALGTEEKVAAELRAHRIRRPGVPYKLRVIDGSGGMLELVEEDPRPRAHWFFEWARALQHTHFGM